MTALLTDEEIREEAREYSDGDRWMDETRDDSLYGETHFEAGARFARSIYEARLAEDQALIRSLTRWDSGRMEFVHADDQRISERDQMTVKRAHAALAAAKEIKNG